MLKRQCLFFYKSPHDPQPLGCIPLNPSEATYEVVRCNDESDTESVDETSSIVTSDSSRKNCFDFNSAASRNENGDVSIELISLTDMFSCDSYNF